jgi:hypothetical protein
MGIMDMFKAAPAATPASIPAPTQVGTPGNPNLPQAAPALNADGTVAAPAAAATPSPLDDHAKLWQNDDTNKGAAPAPLFDIDPAKLNDAIKSADFTASIPPDIMAKALSGDVAAFQAAMNGVAQKAFSHQTMATTKLIEQALDRRAAELEAKMPEMVRRASVSEQLAESPIFTHEATRPLMAALQTQLQAKFPKATASQIAEQARNYISDFAKLAGGTPAQTPEAMAAAAKDDWSSF